MYSCRKCSSNRYYLKQRGTQVGMYCADCDAWIKWVGKSELPKLQLGASESLVNTYLATLENYLKQVSAPREVVEAYFGIKTQLEEG